MACCLLQPEDMIEKMTKKLLENTWWGCHEASKVEGIKEHRKEKFQPLELQLLVVSVMRIYAIFSFYGYRQR